MASTEHFVAARLRIRRTKSSESLVPSEESTLLPLPGKWAFSHAGASSGHTSKSRSIDERGIIRRQVRRESKPRPCPASVNTPAHSSKDAAAAVPEVSMLAPQRCVASTKPWVTMCLDSSGHACNSDFKRTGPSQGSSRFIGNDTADAAWRHAAAGDVWSSDASSTASALASRWPSPESMMATSRSWSLSDRMAAAAAAAMTPSAARVAPVD
mmetsp:Transcript_55460/g.152833  ORF Transcript_55460/g.152833 Transcript_55460/m.152833 type:complete len:212 (+) Transcript_55460:2373-3008(+)